MRRPLVAVALFVLVAGGVGAGAQDDAFWKKTPAQLLEGIENQHPAAYYILASKLLEAGKGDEAVFWFYAGQLRYRFHLASNPDLPPDGDPALFASLSEVAGKPLNEYAFSDLKTLRATIQRVLDWDARTANGFTSKEKHAAEWKEIRGGLEKMSRYIEENADSIRRDRKINGLENRNGEPR